MKNVIVAVLVSVLLIACQATIPVTTEPTTVTPPGPTTVFEESTKVSSLIDQLAPDPTATPIPTPTSQKTPTALPTPQISPHQFEFLDQWGSQGSGEGQFGAGPSGIAADLDGNVYAVDLANSRVQKFNSSGNFLSQWGSEGEDEGQFVRG